MNVKVDHSSARTQLHEAAAAVTLQLPSVPALKCPGQDNMNFTDSSPSDVDYRKSLPIQHSRVMERKYDWRQ